MSGGAPRWLIGLLVGAMVVDLLSTLGWLAWQRIDGRVERDPVRAAESLGDGLISHLPSTVHRSTRLSTSKLTQVSREIAGTALLRVGDLQVAWFGVDPEGYANRGRGLLLTGRVGDAVKQLEQALRRDPTDVVMNRLMAVVLRAMGRAEESLEYLAVAESIAPNFRKPVVELTPEEGSWVRLEALRRRARGASSQRVVATKQLADELRRRGQPEEARAVAEEMADHPEIRMYLADWDQASGDLDAAIEVLEGIARDHRYPKRLRARAQAQLAECIAAQGDDEAAAAAAAAALELAPDIIDPYRALARIASGRGDHAAALEYLRRAWGMDPGNVGLLVQLARTAQRAGRLQDAQIALERAAELDAENPERVAELVRLYLARGSYMEAAMRLSDAMDRFPDHPGLLRLAGRLRQEVGMSSPSSRR